MPISIAALKALAAAGATVEMVIAAVEAQQLADTEADVEKRRKDRERKRRSRLSRGQRVTSRDIADAAQPIAAAANPETQLVVPNENDGHKQNGGQKERSPTPPKEKLLLPLPPLSLFEEVRGSETVRARRNERAARLPDDWTPTLTDIAFGRSLLTEAQVTIETEKFRDYWHARAGPGAVKRSWSATWRNWCRKQAEGENGHYRKQQGNSHSNGTTSNIVQAGLRRVAEFRELARRASADGGSGNAGEGNTGVGTRDADVLLLPKG